MKIGNRNPEKSAFYQGLLSLVKRAFENFFPSVSQFDIPIESQLLSYRKVLEQLPEYDQVQEIIDRDPSIQKYIAKPIQIFTSSANIDLTYILIYFLKKQFTSGSGERVFSQSIFDKIYQDLELFFQSKTVPFLCSAPHYNFNADLDKIELNNGYQIHRIAPTGRKTLPKDREMYGPFDLLSLNAEFWLEVICDFPISIGAEGKESSFTPDEYLHENFYRLITALRLFKPAMLSLQIIECKPVLEVPFCDECTYHLNERPDFLGPKYSLTREEIYEFQDFWKIFSITPIDTNNYLKIALQRLNFACIRKKLEDQVIDLAISFEALLASEFSPEIGYRLAVRTSKLLEIKDIGKRKKIFTTMKKFYDLRSRITHGGFKKGDDENIRIIHEYLRTAIRKYVIESQKIGNKKLDDYQKDWLLNLDLQ